MLIYSHAIVCVSYKRVWMLIALISEIKTHYNICTYGKIILSDTVLHAYAHAHIYTHIRTSDHMNTHTLTMRTVAYSIFVLIFLYLYRFACTAAVRIWCCCCCCRCCTTFFCCRALKCISTQITEVFVQMVVYTCCWIIQIFMCACSSVSICGLPYNKCLFRQCHCIHLYRV